MHRDPASTLKGGNTGICHRGVMQHSTRRTYFAQLHREKRRIGHQCIGLCADPIANMWSAWVKADHAATHHDISISTFLDIFWTINGTTLAPDQLASTIDDRLTSLLSRIVRMSGPVRSIVMLSTPCKRCCPGWPQWSCRR
ncbi:hypothetical protein TNCV_2195531 [Trichonephila clavipes]|uniref:Uncharacterized protein n=1 Tax=Trichonephila clavipes TaxID=2585209 RepID=A0A8X6VA66_TRICX|nr:hypothetical protein TNCV_2195531 [Trichonephila clavipes]